MAREQVSSPVEQPGFQMRKGPRRSCLKQLGDGLFLEKVEHLRLAEEVRHSDQQFLVEQGDFLRVLLEEADVARQAVELVDAHAALNPPVDRALLVAGEVVPTVGAEKYDDLFQSARRFFLGRDTLLGHSRQMAGILHQLGG